MEWYASIKNKSVIEYLMIREDILNEKKYKYSMIPFWFFKKKYVISVCGGCVCIYMCVYGSIKSPRLYIKIISDYL